MAAVCAQFRLALEKAFDPLGCEVEVEVESELQHREVPFEPSDMGRGRPPLPVSDLS